jgi:hypothetical protein
LFLNISSAGPSVIWTRVAFLVGGGMSLAV